MNEAEETEYLAHLEAEDLAADFDRFATEHLFIRSKAGSTVRLKLNRAQRHVRAKLDEQQAKTGRVRALLLKARQQGFSTYIAARFYWKSSHTTGQQVFILTHEDDATNNLFGMVDRYHEHSTSPTKPSTSRDNTKELRFDRLDSGYSVGTAGAKARGRSKTVQLFHGSEVGFWPNAASHFAGVVQAIPDLPGTEIVLESTANGVGGEFHARWQQAEAGIGDYIAIFVPWFWSDEYRRPIPPGFTLDEDEQREALTHGLDLEQMAWRRAKVAELKDPLLFKQEYPATAAEAFQTTGHDSFIKPESVLKARKATHEGIGPLIIGADPAQMGADRFSVARRKGRKVFNIESKTKLDTVAGANWMRTIIDTEKPAKMFIDVGGSPGVYDLLVSWGYGDTCTPVNFGSAPMDPEELLPDGTKRPGPKNRRAEMWSRSRDWLNEEGGADIPDSDTIQTDACGPSFGFDAYQRLLLESKDHMRARGVRSPDEWDAVVLTFAEPVRDYQSHDEREPDHYGEQSWMM